jgi:hypothetical protein
MPFVSEAQRRKFYATPSLHKYINEYNAATPKGKLPEHVADKAPALHAAAVAHVKRNPKRHN